MFFIKRLINFPLSKFWERKHKETYETLIIDKIVYLQVRIELTNNQRI